MKKYNYYLVLFLMLVISSSQAAVYPNFNQLMANTDYVVNPGATGSGGQISITNDVLRVNIGGSWTIAQNLKLGTIRTLAISPVLPNLEVGELKTNTGNPTGYFLKIENNNVIIYTVGTPVLLTGFSLSATIGLVRSWYLDNDFDGLGDPLNAVLQYNKPAGNYVLDNTDNCPLIPGTNASCTVLEADLLNQSFIKNITYKVPTSTSIPNPTITQANQNKTFFDGLGRPIQQIALGQSGTGNDIITQMDYDVYARMPKDFLPYATTSSSLNYRVTARAQLGTFYNTVNYENTSNPYSEKVFENSPLNRVLKQAAPGSSWAVDSGHEIKSDYQTNSAGELTLFKAVTYWNTALNLYETTLIKGVYGDNQLIKTVTYDENNTAVNLQENTGSVVEFKNREGQIVLKRTYDAAIKHDTYYVYDIYGNLTYVIPPKAVDLIETKTSKDSDLTSTTVIIPSSPALNLTASNSIRLLPGFHAQSGSTFSAVIDPNKTILDNLCYQYKYDSRNRLVEKKLPGKQWEFIVYDKLDRVVATGPANSPFMNLTSAGWLITKYDAFNRPIITGWIAATVNSSTRKTLQENQNGVLTSASEVKIATATDNKMPSGTGVAFRYTNAVWPTIDYHILTVNYYDDYNFPEIPVIPATVADGDQPVYYNTTIKPKGLPTGSWTRILESSTDYRNEQTYTLYDGKARVVRSYTKNFLGGSMQVDSRLDDFSGQLKYTITKHKRLSNSAEIIAKDSFIYSAQDRLLTQSHLISPSTTAEVLVSNSYDELGQLISKGVGNNNQNINYTYNIRGWLTGINDINSLTKSGDQKDLFAFKINYNTLSTGISGVNALYNGNIAETLWNSISDANSTTRAYGYQYDKLNRLTNAAYQKKVNSVITANNYNENLTYDKNGNIITLLRNGSSDTSVLQIDNLAYSYKNASTSNQLSKVVDSAPAAYKGNGFIDGTNSDDDYAYDANGNMIIDKNKGIINETADAITYNHLNLPAKIIFGANGNIAYLYSALGQKVQKVVTINSPLNVTTTDYLEGYQYENNILKFFPTAEGYVEPFGSSYRYVYQYKDHLGNIHLSCTKNSVTGVLDVLDENHYYPFGLKQTGYGAPIVSSSYKYKYNGKELQDDNIGGNQLNVYDYGWRNYDASIGRFMKIDRFAEKYVDATPYHYSANNPVAFRDIAGDSIRTYFYNREGKKTNSIPDAVQKMFNEEFGISVGYNSKTNMLYYSGDYESDLSQSESATNSLVDALKDDNTGKEADKHGTIEFGYNRRGIQGGDIQGGQWNRGGGIYYRGLTQIDLADFDSQGNFNLMTSSSALNPRAYNMARIFEHEYLGGHQKMMIGGFGDGELYTMGKVVRATNLFARERHIPERLHYGENVIFFGGTMEYANEGEQRKAVKSMINGTTANNLFMKSKK